MNKSHILRAAFVDVKGQRVAYITQMTCFENAIRNSPFYFPNRFFDQCVVEMIVLSRSIVLLGKARVPF